MIDISRELKMIGKLVGLVFAAVIIGALVPVALTSIANANVTSKGNGAGVYAVWGILGVVIVIGVALLILKEAGVMD